MKKIPFGLLLVLILGGPSTRAAEAPLSEKDKIEALIKHVGNLKEGKFIRNGREYDAETAVTFLKRKWDSVKDEVTTAKDFIEKVASMSSTSGKPYEIKLKDGKTVKAGDYLKDELKRIEKAGKP